MVRVGMMKLKDGLMEEMILNNRVFTIVVEIWLPDIRQPYQF
jgi:hypothetical protein